MNNTNSDQQRLNGMKCPQCGGFIPCTMMDILSSGRLICPSCGLVLNIDKSKSAKAIEALEKVAEERKKSERVE